MKFFFATIFFGIVTCYALAGQFDQSNVENPQHDDALTRMLHSAGVADVKEARLWFNKLKKAILTRDQERLMTMIAFPVRVGTDKEYIKIDAPEEFIDKWDDIITPNLIAIVDCTDFEDLWANYAGIRIGSGVIIIQSIYVDAEKKSSELKIRIFYNGSLMQNDLEECSKQ